MASPLKRVSRESPFASRAIAGAGAELAAMCGTLLCILIIARMEGVELVGWFSLLIWMNELLSTWLAPGLTASLTRTQAQWEADSSLRSQLPQLSTHLFTANVLLLPLGWLLAIMVWPRVFPHIAEYMPGSQVAILLTLRHLRSCYMAWLKGRQAYTQAFRVNLLTAILQISGVYLGLRLYGTQGLLPGFMIGYLPPAALSLTMLRSRKRLAREHLRTIATFAAATGIAACLSICSSWSRMELVFLERIGPSPEAAGLFAVVLYLTTLVARLTALSSEAFLPHFATLVGKQSAENLAPDYRAACRIIALGLFPLSLFGAALLPLLLPTLLGQGFSEAIRPGIILMVFSTIYFTSIGSSLVFGMGRSRFIAWSSALTTAFFLVLCIGLIPAWGIWGAVAARILGQLAAISWGLAYLHRRLGIHTPGVALCKTFLAAGIPALLLAGVVETKPGLEWVIPAFLTCGIGYLVLVHICQLGTRDYKQLNRLYRHLPGSTTKLGQRLFKATIGSPS